MVMLVAIASFGLYMVEKFINISALLMRPGFPCVEK
jgi:hypothetical protein